MAQKKITDLQLRSDFDDTCNIPVDDAVQTWRVTGEQVVDFLASEIAPLSAVGDLLIGGASGAPVILPGSTSATPAILTQTGNGSASATPAWRLFKAPLVTRLTSGSGTFTPDANALYRKIRMVGGGGGGGGSGTGDVHTNGGTGGNTTFGDWTAGGAAGTAAGTNTVGTGTLIRNQAGVNGGGHAIANAGIALGGGFGSASPFGGAGTGAWGSAGGAATANTGSGGGGGGTDGAATQKFTGAGGASGGYLEFLITSSSAVSYSVGIAGAAGVAGTSGSAGAAGGSGVIEVIEYYQ